MCSNDSESGRLSHSHMNNHLFASEDIDSNVEINKIACIIILIYYFFLFYWPIFHNKS